MQLLSTPKLEVSFLFLYISTGATQKQYFHFFFHLGKYLAIDMRTVDLKNNLMFNQYKKPKKFAEKIWVFGDFNYGNCLKLRRYRGK